MYKPITNWNALQRALRARRDKIFACADCNYVFIVRQGSEKPGRCPNPECRAWENVPRRERPGRPSAAVLAAES